MGEEIETMNSEVEWLAAELRLHFKGSRSNVALAPLDVLRRDLQGALLSCESAERSLDYTAEFVQVETDLGLAIQR